MNVNCVYRLYRELGLQLRNKTPKRRVKAKLRDNRKPAASTNEVWAMDLVHDADVDCAQLQKIYGPSPEASPAECIGCETRVVFCKLHKAAHRLTPAMAAGPLIGFGKLRTS